MMLNKTFHLILLSLIPLLGFSQEPSQYPDSGNKIRLGLQTTGDGLIWRDTQPKVPYYQPINNKAAWIVLDTVNNKFYHYKDSTWTLAGGQDIDTANLIATKYNLGFKLSLADTQNMLTPYWRSGRFMGVLPLANGGTGQSTLAAAGIITGSGTSNKIPKFNTTNSLIISKLNDDATTLTYTGNEIVAGDNLNNDAFFTMNAIQNNYLQFKDPDGGSGAINYNHTNDYLAFKVNGFNRLTIINNGNVGIGTASPAVQFHTTGGVRFATFAGGGNSTLDVDNTGNLARTSSIELKKDVTPISYGLNEILQINPINFNWIDEDKFGNENENGFIAEDIMNIIPNVVGSDVHGLFMDYKKLIPILTKAIQEQNLLIKALEQRILILENK